MSEQEQLLAEIRELFARKIEIDRKIDEKKKLLTVYEDEEAMQ